MRVVVLITGLLLSACLVEPVEEAKYVADDAVSEVDEHELHDGELTDEEIGMIAKGNENPCPLPKIRVCHLPSSDPEKAITLCISASAVSAHQFHHGDSIGACPELTTCARKGSECSPSVGCCTGACIAGACRTTCQPYGEACYIGSDCCNGASCVDGLCTPQA